MKVKSFKTYLEKRLDKKDIQEIKDAAKIEFEILTELQAEVAETLINYMTENKLGFNDLVGKDRNGYGQGLDHRHAAF